MTPAISKRLAAAALLATAISSGPAWAADVAAPAEGTGGWVFTATAYGWGAGINGKAGVFGLPPQDVDLSFGDVLQDLDFAVMGLGEARKDRFVLGVDLTYSNVGSSTGTPFGILADKLDATTTTWMATGFGGYALFDNDVVRLEAIAGARLWSVNTDFELKGGLLDGRSKSDGATWVDPLMGARLHVDVTPDIYLNGWAMAGGFGLSSDMMWDLMGGAGYRFTDNFSVFAGYRALSVDYSNGGFVYDVVQKGPVAAAVFRF